MERIKAGNFVDEAAVCNAYELIVKQLENRHPSDIRVKECAIGIKACHDLLTMAWRVEYAIKKATE